MQKFFNQIKILSQKEAVQLVNHYGVDKYWDIVSITEPFEPVDFYQHAKNVCRLGFNDIDKITDKMTICSKTDIQKVLKFSESVLGGNLVIHCWAGISRSSSITFAILLNLYKDKVKFPVDKALDDLVQIKSIHCIHPNRFILNLALETIARNEEELIRWSRELYQSEIFHQIYNS